MTGLFLKTEKGRYDSDGTQKCNQKHRRKQQRNDPGENPPEKNFLISRHLVSPYDTSFTIMLPLSVSLRRKSFP